MYSRIHCKFTRTDILSILFYAIVVVNYCSLYYVYGTPQLICYMTLVTVFFLGQL